MSQRPAGEPAPPFGGRQAELAAGLWLLLVPAGALVLLAVWPPSSDYRAPSVSRDLLPLLGSWLLLVGALASARAPGVAAEVERAWTRSALAAGVLAVASASLLALLALRDLPRDLAVGHTVALFVLGAGSLLGATAFLSLWLLLACEVFCLPRGSRSEELARVGHLAALPLAAAAFWGSELGSKVIAPSALVRVPAPIAHTCTLAGIVLVLAVWLRLRRTGE